jgi:Uma2 family endonuclease
MTATAQNHHESTARYSTAAEWLHDLGDVPLERIIFDPWPGSATEADLLRKVEVDKQLCELINGTLVEKPMGLYESTVAAALIHVLMNFVLPRRLGAVSGEAGTLRLAPKLVRLPDVAFISSKRFVGKTPLEPIPSIAPDLAVEILSESNTKREIDRKIAEYFTAGTLLCWIIDPATRTAKVYTSPSQWQPIEPTGTLDGGDVLPGFKLPLKELFAMADQMLSGS